MRTLFVCALVLTATYNAAAADNPELWRIYSKDSKGHKLVGEAFTATKEQAEARLAWANSLQPNVERHLVALTGMIPAPDRTKPVFRLLTTTMEPENDRAERRLFAVSLSAALAGHALDVFSSYNKPELNPVLQSGKGRFEVQSTLTKSAVVGGLEILQLWEIHRNPRLRKVAIWTNFIVAGVMSGVAAHNFTVPAH